MVRSLDYEPAKRMSMTWARLVAVMPLILGGAVCAQSANERDTPLGSCFRSARIADEVCRRENDPKQRSDCFHKVSAAQLECLEHALTEGATASQDSSSTVPLGPPTNPGSNVPSNGASPDELSQRRPDAADAKPADGEPATTASLPKRTKTGNCTHFRTYDATSGTYRAYDGRIRECR